MQALYVIPARGGSKGLPGKNCKLLLGKPLIQYAIEVALKLTSASNICVTTDDLAVKEIAERLGIKVPFLRPSELSNDTASMNDVLLHAIHNFGNSNQKYDVIVLLQPTSPLRTVKDVQGALSLFSMDDEMVMSVFKTKANPYYVLFEEEFGFLQKSKKGNVETRQQAPTVYQANGAVYVINAKALLKKNLTDFVKIKKFEMSELNSVDIDTLIDWQYCEFLLSNQFVAI